MSEWSSEYSYATILEGRKIGDPKITRSKRESILSKDDLGIRGNVNMKTRNYLCCLKLAARCVNAYILVN